MKFLFTILCLFTFLTSWSTEIKQVNNKSCSYSIHIPEGWEEISMDSIVTKFQGEAIDFAIHYKSDSSYFRGEYILFRFFPSINSLGQFKFSDIAKEVGRNMETTNASTEKSDKGLSSNAFKVDEANLSFHVAGTLVSNEGRRDYRQVIIPTQFGYLMVIAYQAVNSNQKISLSESDLYSCIAIDTRFKYTEPKSKLALNFWHLIIAISIGAIVYVVIEYAPKLKRDSKVS